MGVGYSEGISSTPCGDWDTVHRGLERDSKNKAFRGSSGEGIAKGWSRDPPDHILDQPELPTWRADLMRNQPSSQNTSREHCKSFPASRASRDAN